MTRYPTLHLLTNVVLLSYIHTCIYISNYPTAHLVSQIFPPILICFLSPLSIFVIAWHTLFMDIWPRLSIWRIFTGIVFDSFIALCSCYNPVGEAVLSIDLMAFIVGKGGIRSFLYFHDIKGYWIFMDLCSVQVFGQFLTLLFDAK